jgi:hypothetical protein
LHFGNGQKIRPTKTLAKHEPLPIEHWTSPGKWMAANEPERNLPERLRKESMLILETRL